MVHCRCSTFPPVGRCGIRALSRRLDLPLALAAWLAGFGWLARAGSFLPLAALALLAAARLIAADGATRRLIRPTAAATAAGAAVGAASAAATYALFPLVASRSPGLAGSVRLLGEADDAADELEDAAFLLTLLPRPAAVASLRKPLEHLGALLVAAAEEWARCLAAASQARRRGARDGLQGFLESVDRIALLEDQADEAERALKTALFAGDTDPRALQLLVLVAQAFEHAADALAHSALALRDHLLEELTSR